MQHPADDFSAFAGNEHMFYGVKKPFEFIRRETEAALRRQVEDTVLDAIETFDTPKFLTLGRQLDGGKQILVTHFGCCVRARLFVTYGGGTQHELIEATLTFLFGDVDQRGSERSRFHADLHGEAAQRFNDQAFKERFLAFRLEAFSPSGSSLDSSLDGGE